MMNIWWPPKRLVGVIVSKCKRFIGPALGASDSKILHRAMADFNKYIDHQSQSQDYSAGMAAKRYLENRGYTNLKLINNVLVLDREGTKVGEIDGYIYNDDIEVATEAKKWIPSPQQPDLVFDDTVDELTLIETGGIKTVKGLPQLVKILKLMRTPDSGVILAHRKIIVKRKPLSKVIGILATEKVDPELIRLAKEKGIILIGRTAKWLW